MRLAVRTTERELERRINLARFECWPDLYVQQATADEGEILYLPKYNYKNRRISLQELVQVMLMVLDFCRIARIVFCYFRNHNIRPTLSGQVSWFLCAMCIESFEELHFFFILKFWYFAKNNSQRNRKIWFRFAWTERQQRKVIFATGYRIFCLNI